MVELGLEAWVNVQRRCSLRSLQSGFMYLLTVSEGRVLYRYTSGFFRLLVWLILGSGVAWGSLTRDDIIEIYGEPKEVIREVPGRPWVDTQWRFESDDLTISCNFVGELCLWIDFRVKGITLDEPRVFQELARLFPDAEWTPKSQHGRVKWWLNHREDRVTKRATGFTLHMHDYIRNVLSRREQWQF